MSGPLIDFLNGFHDWTSELSAAAFPFLNPQPGNPFSGYNNFAPSDMDIANLWQEASDAGYQIPDYIRQTIVEGKDPFIRSQMFGSTRTDLNKFREDKKNQETAGQLDAGYQQFMNDPNYNRLKTLVEGWATTPFVNDQEVTGMVQQGLTDVGTAARHARQTGLEDLAKRGIADSGIAAQWENTINQTADNAAAEYRVNMPLKMKEINRDRASNAVTLANNMQSGRDSVGMQYNIAAKAALAGAPIPSIDFSGLQDTFGQASEAEANYTSMKRLTEAGQFDKMMQMLMQAIGMGGQIGTGVMSSIMPMLASSMGGGGGGGGSSGGGVSGSFMGTGGGFNW